MQGEGTAKAANFLRELAGAAVIPPQKRACLAARDAVILPTRRAGLAARSETVSNSGPIQVVRQSSVDDPQELVPATHGRAALVLAPLLGTFAPASAQPLQLPGAGAGTPPGAVQPPPAVGPSAPGPGLPSGRPAAPPPVRAVPEDAVAGQALLHNGRAGRVVMEKRRGGFALRFMAEGFEVDNLTEPCAVSFGDEAIELESLGRPAGLARFRLKAPVCPIVFDVLPNAILVVEPQQPCVVEAAKCRIIPRGLWGPDGRGLVALARDIERERARAEAQVRDGFRALGQRAGPDDRRMVAREQAGFSSEREQICREFNREANHGFCAAKVTEARAASIRARLAEGERPQANRR